jgi:hypothetical protein
MINVLNRKERECRESEGFDSQSLTVECNAQQTYLLAEEALS